MKKDLILKDITKEAIKEVLKNILNLDINDFEFLDFEFPKIEKRDADILIKADNKIIHIEFQTNNDKNMHIRMARYFLEIYLRYKLEIYQYVLFLGKKLSMKNKILTNSCNYSYEIIDLKTIPCDRFLNVNNPNALVLAILCDFKNQNSKEVIKTILHKLYHLSKNENDFRKYLLMLEELSTSRDLKSEIKEVEMGLQNLTWEDLPSYEIGLERGIKRGIQKGLKQGILKGRVITLYELDFPIEEIAKRLNLNIEKVKNILKENND